MNMNMTELERKGIRRESIRESEALRDSGRESETECEREQLSN
jgi:hypothetical protein